MAGGRGAPPDWLGVQDNPSTLLSICPSPVAEDSEFVSARRHQGTRKMPLPTLPISVLLPRPLLKRIYCFISSFFLHFPLNTLKRKAANLLSQPHPQVKTTANRNGRQRNECSPLLRGPYTFSPSLFVRHPQG